MIDWIGFAAEEANAMRDVDVRQDGGRVENLDRERRTLFIKPKGRSVQWRRDGSVISMLRNLLLVLH